MTLVLINLSILYVLYNQIPVWTYFTFHTTFSIYLVTYQCWIVCLRTTFQCNSPIHLVFWMICLLIYASSWMFGYYWSITMNISAKLCELILEFPSSCTYWQLLLLHVVILTFWMAPNYSCNMHIPLNNNQDFSFFTYLSTLIFHTNYSDQWSVI